MHDRFLCDILANGHNRAILARWQQLDLPDGWLVAGCLFQTVWNLRSGFDPQAHIKDYDLFYFDGGDLSAQAEQAVQRRVAGLLSDLGVTVEARNQARVHCWYEDYFGFAYPQLHSSCEGIDRFLVPATSVGVRPAHSGFEVYAPYGLSLLYEGRLFPNPLTRHLPLFHTKARSYRARWPWLQMEEADGAGQWSHAKAAPASCAIGNPR